MAAKRNRNKAKNEDIFDNTQEWADGFCGKW
jgi:hypothetical protein